MRTFGVWNVQSNIYEFCYFVVNAMLSHGLLGYLGIAYSVYETPAMQAETKRLVKINVCHLYRTHRPKLTPVFAIFQSANGRIGSTVCYGSTYRTRFYVMNRVRHWTSRTRFQNRVLCFGVSPTLTLWRLGLPRWAISAVCECPIYTSEQKRIKKYFHLIQ
jgi:hypothetical protein